MHSKKVRWAFSGENTVIRYLLPVFMVLCASAASAQTEPPRPEPLVGVYACAATENDAERLACYDAAVGRMRQAETEGQFVAVDRQQVEAMRRESFGFALPNVANLFSRGGGGEEALDRLEFQVERVSARADGRHIFVMSDGQRWSQVEPRSASNVRAGDTVTVRRAALGSYMLSPERGGAAHRVRREN